MSNLQRIYVGVVLTLLGAAFATSRSTAFAAEVASKDSSNKEVLRDGDRVVMLGGTFIEREGNFGYIETVLTSAYPDRKLVFRNLGWSGDTVWAESRGIFDPPAKGYARLIEQVNELQPTLIILGYGVNESYAGDTGIPAFITQYEKLIQDLSAENRRFVLLTPYRLEKAQPPLPDSSLHNATLGKYAAAIKELAGRVGATLVDLYQRTEPKEIVLEPGTEVEQLPRGFQREGRVCRTHPITENGIHLSRYGYLRVARIIAQRFHCPGSDVMIFLHRDGAIDELKGATISNFEAKDRQAEFTVLRDRLPLPVVSEVPDDCEFYVVAGPVVPEGTYQLKIDNQFAGDNFAPRIGFRVKEGADFAHAEKLRQKIVEKNLLYFHRWRPQNVTYLFLFRKHEQGNNAVEIPQFDRLISDAELAIDELKKPVQRRFAIVPKE